MGYIHESIFFPGALSTYLSTLTPSPSIESFANKFIRENEAILGTDARIEPHFTSESDAAEEALISYQLTDGKSLKIGIERRESGYPEAIIGIKT